MRRASPSMPRPPRGQSAVSVRGKRDTTTDPDLGKIARSLRSGRPPRVRSRRTEGHQGRIVGASVPRARAPAAGMEANDTLVQAPDPNLLCPICINVLDNPLRTPCG